MRVALPRTGVVLSESGGALEKMLPFFKLGIGGPVAGGRQYVPWVHLDDVVGAHRCSRSTTTRPRGPLNVTAPEPVTNKELSQRARARAAPARRSRRCPALAVKTLYGEMAVIVTTGQRAVPARLPSWATRSSARTSRTRCARRPGRASRRRRAAARPPLRS